MPSNLNAIPAHFWCPRMRRELRAANRFLLRSVGILERQSVKSGETEAFLVGFQNLKFSTFDTPPLKYKDGIDDF